MVWIVLSLACFCGEADLMNKSLSFNMGEQLYTWAKDLFPIARSITGNGVRQTLGYFRKLIPEIAIFEVPSGTQAFDWVVPQEWNIRDAYVADKSGNRIIDFKTSNLHVVGYSEPVDQEMCFSELDQHIYSIPEQPNAIPYVTSYYKRWWGFCLSENQRAELRNQPNASYHVCVDSSFSQGSLTYGELIIKGELEQEVLLSTYICHPSMANNELSGPVVAVGLARWLYEQSDRRYTYRILFLPETIGSIVYLSRHLEHMKKNIIAGYVLTCLGDDREYSYLASRNGNTLADRVAKHVLKHHAASFKKYSFLERGSDERQYCWPGVDLPVCSIMRSKYAEYPEYHTSLDNLDFISPKGLQGAFDVLQKSLNLIENNYTYKVNICCEPQLGRRGLYPSLSTKNTSLQVRSMMNLIAYADGSRDLIDIAELIDEDAFTLVDIAQTLLNMGVLIRLD
jgi:aminopeptidase-like protein